MEGKGKLMGNVIGWVLPGSGLADAAINAFSLCVARFRAVRVRAQASGPLGVRAERGCAATGAADASA